MTERSKNKHDLWHFIYDYKLLVEDVVLCLLTATLSTPNHLLDCELEVTESSSFVKVVTSNAS